MKQERLCRLTLIATIVLTPVHVFAEGTLSERAGDAMSDQHMNQPKKSHEKQSTDMTGGREGIVGEYDVVPVRLGGLVDEKGATLDQTVKNKKGEILGTIEKLLKDTKTGKIEYAVLELEETKFQLPLQWSQFKQEGGHLTLNASKNDLYPTTDSIYSKDMSPDISHYMDEINKVRDQPKAQGGGPGASGFPFSSVGGFGSSGPPPGPAPGYEGADTKSKR
ncbi:MAG: PRC-barrel domain-containing protein [Nitrospira sp.]|nr:PRC-barrel domain-containing protein [Nitrospira sp.]